MDVNTRISALRLINKEKKKPEFFKEIGVATKMKVIDEKAKKAEKNSCIKEEK